MKQRNITILFITFILISFSFLAYYEDNQHKIENEWFLYFENPQNNSLNFVVENFSDKNNFSWHIIVDDDEVKSGNMEVLKNNRKTVILEKLPESKKITVKIINDGGEKKIYKTI